MISQWNNLPTEIQQNVLTSCLGSERACMLVCKNWYSQALPLFYNTVRIRSFQQHLRFTESIKSSGHGVFVKHLQFDTEAFEEASSFYASMFDDIPNLETVGRFYYSCYWYLLDAIVDGKLERLKDIPFPDEDYEFDAYASCVFHLKDRITSLTICEYEKSKQLERQYDRTMKILNTSNTLNRLKVSKLTADNINFMEFLINGRSHLKHLELGFYKSEDEDAEVLNRDQEKIDWDQEKIDALVPAKNITFLDITVFTDKPKALTLYIMHKFPNLKKLKVTYLEHDQTQWLSEDDPPVFKRLCDFLPLAKVDNLLLNSEILWDMLEYYLSSRRNLKSLSLEFRPFFFPEYTGPYLSFDDTVNSCSVTVQGSNFTEGMHFTEGMPLEMFEKYGKYVQALNLHLDSQASALVESSTQLPSKFSGAIFQHCINLKTLCIYNGYLEYIDPSPSKDPPLLTLNFLRIRSCYILEEFFLSMAFSVHHIKKMTLADNTYYDKDLNETSHLHLLMKNVTFGFFEFHDLDYQMERKDLILRIITKAQGKFFYKINARNTHYEKMDEEAGKYNPMDKNTNSITLDCLSAEQINIRYGTRMFDLKAVNGDYNIMMNRMLFLQRPV